MSSTAKVMCAHGRSDYIMSQIVVVSSPRAGTARKEHSALPSFAALRIYTQFTTVIVMQVLIGTLLSLLLVTYAPLGRLSTYLASLGTVMLIVVLLESRRVLNDFLSFKVRLCEPPRAAHKCSSLANSSLFRWHSCQMRYDNVSAEIGISGDVLQIDYNNIASGIMGLHLSEEADESMNRTTSLDASYSSGSFGSNTLDVATKTATYASSSYATVVCRLGPEDHDRPRVFCCWFCCCPQWQYFCSSDSLALPGLPHAPPFASSLDIL